MMCGDSVNTEIRKTSTVSFDILLRLPSAYNGTAQLFNLAQRSSMRCPEISAANLLAIDISTLFTILGSLTSYIIVTIQFSK